MAQDHEVCVLCTLHTAIPTAAGCVRSASCPGPAAMAMVWETPRAVRRKHAAFTLTPTASPALAAFHTAWSRRCQARGPQWQTQRAELLRETPSPGLSRGD